MSWIDTIELNLVTHALAKYMTSEIYVKVSDKMGQAAAVESINFYLDNFKEQYKQLPDKTDKNMKALITYMCKKGPNAPTFTDNDIKENQPTTTIDYVTLVVFLYILLLLSNHI